MKYKIKHDFYGKKEYTLFREGTSAEFSDERAEEILNALPGFIEKLSDAGNGSGKGKEGGTGAPDAGGVLQPLDLVATSRVYVNNMSLRTGNGSINAPFQSISSALEYVKSAPEHEKAYHIIELADGEYDEDIVINNEDYDQVIRSWGGEYSHGARVGNVDIKKAGYLHLHGISVSECATISTSKGTKIKMEDCNAERVKIEYAEGAIIGSSGYVKFSQGSARSIEITGGDMIKIEGYDLPVSIVIDAPHSAVEISGCKFINVVERKQCAALYIDRCRMASFTSEDTPGFIAFGAVDAMSSSGSELAPITLKGTAKYNLGGLRFNEKESVLKGEFVGGGIGSLQVWDTTPRQGYKPLIKDEGNSAPVGRKSINYHGTDFTDYTIKDHLNGISDALEKLGERINALEKKG